MATLDVKVGSFTAPTSTGPQNVAGIGFAAKVIFFFVTRRESADTDNDYVFGVGAADGTSQWAISASNQNGQGTTVCDRSFDGGNCVDVQIAGTYFGQADLTGINADDFDLNWSVAPATGFRVHFIAIGGSDVSAKVGTFNAPTSTGNADVTGIGFVPESILLANSRSDASDGTAVAGLINFGYTTSTSDTWSTATNGRDAQGTSEEARRFSDTLAIMRINRQGAPGTVSEGDFVSFATDKFTINWLKVEGAAVRHGYVALRGVSFKASTFNQNASTGNQSVTGVSFKPQCVLFGGCFAPTADANTNENIIMAGFTAGTNQGSVQGVAKTALPASATRRRDTTTAVISRIDQTGTLKDEASIASLDDDGFTINLTTVSGATNFHGYLAIGEPVVAAGPGTRFFGGLGDWF